MKKITIILCTILTIFVLTGCSKKENKITIGFMSSLGAVPYIYALEEGFYQEVGLEVEIKIFTNANDRDAGLIGKHLDGVNTDYVMLLNMLEDNHDLVVTASTEDKFFIVTNEEYGNKLSDIKSTNNAKVGTFENGVLQYLVSKLAETNEIEYTQVGFPRVPDRLAALEAKTIDMAILPDPFASQVKSKGGKVIWNNLDTNTLVTCLVFRKDYVNNNKELLKKFFNATDLAINKLKSESYDNYKNYIVKHGILNNDNVDLIPKQNYNNLVLPNKTEFNQVVTWMTNKNLIKTKYDLNDISFDWKK